MLDPVAHKVVKYCCFFTSLSLSMNLTITQNIGKKSISGRRARASARAPGTRVNNAHACSARSCRNPNGADITSREAAAAAAAG